MASLNILCFNPFNLGNKIMKIEQENILWPIKNFEKYFMIHQYMPKIFQEPYKNPPPPSPKYLMYGPLIPAYHLAVRYWQQLSCSRFRNNQIELRKRQIQKYRK